MLSPGTILSEHYRIIQQLRSGGKRAQTIRRWTRALRWCMKPLALFALVTASVGVDQPGSEIVHRVRLPPGRTSTVITGEVSWGRSDTYIFSARKGQVLFADVTWQGERVGRKEDEGLSDLMFIDPDGASHAEPHEFEAKSTGDYRVVIRAPYKMTNYTYRFELIIDVQHLRKYAEKDLEQLLKNEPAIANRLKAVLGQHYDLFMKNMTYRTSLFLYQEALLVEGSATRSAGIEDAYLAIPLWDDQLHCAIKSKAFDGKIQTFSEDPKNFPLVIKHMIEWR